MRNKFRLFLFGTALALGAANTFAQIPSNGGGGGGSGITGLTGDVTASGSGNVISTLATVNSNVGTFQSVTVNAKGLVTAATPVTYLAPRVATITYGSTITANWASEDIQTVTLTGNTTITNSGAVDGQRLTLYVIQGGSGSYTVTFATGTAFNTTIPSITLSTTPGAIDMIGLVYRAASGKYNIVAFAQGVS